MTSPIKTASLLLTSILSSACGWDILPDEPTGDATSNADGTVQPTTGSNDGAIPVHFTCYNRSNFPGAPRGPLLLPLDAHAQLQGIPNALLANGSETFWLRNPTAVGRLVDGSLDLRMEVPTMFGSVKVETTRVR
jgi:hypothetical protein